MVLGTDNPYAQPQATFKFPVQPPDVDPDDGDSAVVCFSLAWLPYVMGALQQLTLQASWKDDLVDMQLTLDRAQELLALVGQDNPTCPDILIVKGMRYNPDDDLIEQTFDGGETYVPAPGLDPRHSLVFQFPVVVADDPACQAAANIVRFIENLIEVTLNNIALGSDAVGIAIIFLPLLVTLGPFAILFDLVLALALGLVALGATIIGAAFTPEVYDTLRCIFFCNCDEDGRLTVGSLELIEEQIADQLDSTVQAVTSAMFLLMGEVGLGNAGTQGAAPADCDDCTECQWCYHWAGSEESANWSIYPGQPGSMGAGGFETGLTFVGGDPLRGRRQTIIQIDIPTGTRLTHVRLDGDATLGDMSAGSTTEILANNLTEFLTTPSAAVPGFWSYEWDGDRTDLETIEFVFAVGSCDTCGDPGGTGVIPDIYLYGVGDLPGFLTGGEEC